MRSKVAKRIDKLITNDIDLGRNVVYVGDQAENRDKNNRRLKKTYWNNLNTIQRSKLSKVIS